MKTETLENVITPIEILSLIRRLDRLTDPGSFKISFHPVLKFTCLSFWDT